MRKLLMILLLIAMLVFAGCSEHFEVSYNPTGTFRYQYDEVHDVSIWTWSYGSGGGIAVLSGKDVRNPFEPMKLR